MGVSVQYCRLNTVFVVHHVSEPYFSSSSSSPPIFSQSSCFGSDFKIVNVVTVVLYVACWPHYYGSQCCYCCLICSLLASLLW